VATDEPIVLAESQYKFGLGPILMTHLEVLAEVEFDGKPWLYVRAQVANGTPERHSGWTTRDLYINY
jgi:hypothetical protein